jgi:predicted transcriptional regulator
MTASITPHLDAVLWERLQALASARRMAPMEVLAELIAQAESVQLVAEVNTELERLARSPRRAPETSSDMRRLDAAVRSWMGEAW